MKKILLLSLLFVNTLSVASCEIHWGYHSWYVPPVYVVIPAIAFSIICIAVSMGYISRQDYKCPKCGAVIRPKWYHISAALHIGSDRVIKCPHCGRKGFCKRVD